MICLFPVHDSSETRMVHHVVKKSLKRSFEQRSELSSIHNLHISGEPGRETAQEQCPHFVVSFPQYSGIEAELVAKILKDQALVVARCGCDDIDRDTIESIRCKRCLCCIEDRLTCSFHVVDPFAPSSLARYAHVLMLPLIF